MLVYDPNTGHLLRFGKELSLSPTTAEAFLIQTVQMRTHWPESISQSINLFTLKSKVEKVSARQGLLPLQQQKMKSPLSRCHIFILQREKDFWGRSSITASKIKGIQHVKVFCQWRSQVFSQFHCVLFGKSKFHLFPIMDISFWNKMFKCSRVIAAKLTHMSFRGFSLNVSGL